MNRKVELKWSYTPNNFLETDQELSFNDSKIQFSDGKVLIATNENTLQDDAFFVTNAENKVQNYLNGFSIQRHLPFNLSRKNITYINEIWFINLQFNSRINDS